MRNILDLEGRLVGEAPMDIDTTRRLYRALVETRAYDKKGTTLQRQGRLATYAPLLGQEAAQVGSAAALDPQDWMVATYRDAGAMWMQGYPWEVLFLSRSGDERGGRPPVHVDVLPPSITVGAHMIHAVGIGWAEKLLGTTRLAITYFGDGATSEGDFHEAMNFAGVFKTPTIFLCQNNGWAISMPRERQTASETIAQKADAYGMPGEQVDGNDLFAVYAATKEAVDRARSGEGATLIEAVTYRVGPHTTNDDPGRYRDPEEERQALDRDPIERVRRYLEHEGAWDAEWEETVQAKASTTIERAVELAESLQSPSPEDIFGAVYEEMSPDLRRQLEEVES